jgi:hypothetical protein
MPQDEGRKSRRAADHTDDTDKTKPLTQLRGEDD